MILKSCIRLCLKIAQRFPLLRAYHQNAASLSPKSRSPLLHSSRFLHSLRSTHQIAGSSISKQGSVFLGSGSLIPKSGSAFLGHSSSIPIWGSYIQHQRYPIPNWRSSNRSCESKSPSEIALSMMLDARSPICERPSCLHVASHSFGIALLKLPDCSIAFVHRSLVHPSEPQSFFEQPFAVIS